MRSAPFPIRNGSGIMRTPFALPSFVVAVVAISTAVSAPAVQVAAPDAIPVPGAMRHGTYSVAEGRFEPILAANVGIGPDVLFDTISGCPAYYFGVVGLPGDSIEMIDEASFPDRGCRTPQGTEEINGYTWEYCNLDNAGYFDATLRFYHDTVACQGPSGWPVAECSYLLTGLPDGGCWNVTVDLSCGFECVLPQTSGAGPQGTIGFSVQYQTPSTLVGPVLGTNLQASCIGLGTVDSFELFDTAGYVGCMDFGQTPKARADFRSTFHASPVDVEAVHGTAPGDQICLQAKDDFRPGHATDFVLQDPTASGSDVYVLLVSTGSPISRPMSSSFTSWTLQPSVTPPNPIVVVSFMGSSYTLSVPSNAPACAAFTAQVVRIVGPPSPANVDAASNGLLVHL